MDTNKYIEREFDPDEWNCWILCQTILKDEAGIIVPTFAEHYDEIKKYKKLSQVFEQEREQEDVWLNIEPGKEKQFDIVLMRMRGFPLHVGLVTTPGWMIHVVEGINTTLEEYTRKSWEHRLLGFYRPFSTGGT